METEVSYNCFASTVGYLLRSRGCPWVSCVVDSVFDLYYWQQRAITMHTAGVWPGAEHPRIFELAFEITGRELRSQEHGSREEIWGNLSEAAAKGRKVAVAVPNDRCRHIRWRPGLPVLGHYLVVDSIHDEAVTCWDAFLRREVVLARQQLLEWSRFRANDAEFFCHRTVELGPQTRPAADASSAFDAAMRRRPALGRLLPEGTLEGPAAAIVLADRIERLSRDEMQGALTSLFQAWRYVQYSRQYYVRFLLGLAHSLPACTSRLDSIISAVQEVAQSWFRIKVRAQYFSATQREAGLGELAIGLRKIAAQELRIIGAVERLRTDRVCVDAVAAQPAWRKGPQGGHPSGS